MKQPLTITEQQVFDACKEAEGKEFEDCILIENIRIDDMSRNVLRGYIGQLIKKGWLRVGSWDGTYTPRDTYYTIAKS